MVFTAKHIRLIYVFLLIGLTTFGCDSLGKRRTDKYREMKEMMGSFVSIDVCVNEQNEDRIQRAFPIVWARLEDIAWRMNVFDEKSDVAKLNNAQALPV